MKTNIDINEVQMRKVALAWIEATDTEILDKILAKEFRRREANTKNMRRIAFFLQQRKHGKYSRGYIKEPGEYEPGVYK